MSFEILAFRGRTTDYRGAIYASDGSTPVQIHEDDVVRFKAGRSEGDPLIELASGEVEEGGSTVIVDSVGSSSEPARYTVRLSEVELSDVPPGTYDAEVLLVDVSEVSPPSATRMVDVGVLHVVESLGGAVGEPQ